VTFAAFAERFYRDYGCRVRSEHYAQATKALTRYFGDRRLRSIKKKDIDRFIVDRLQTAGASTVRNNVSALNVMFRKAVEWGVIAKSPVVDPDLPKLPKHRIRYLTLAEWRRFESIASVELRPIATMAVATGMRLKEVVGLRWQDVDFDSSFLYVIADSKTGTRPVPLNQTTHDLITAQERVAGSSFVFTDSSGRDFFSPKRRNLISRRTIDTMRRAGIENASFHTLRHTAASFMVQAGVPLYEVQKILGHATLFMTERYAHLQPGHLRGAVVALDRALRGLKQVDCTESDAGH
jgi:integrase